jgi:predicted transcriptional regulator
MERSLTRAEEEIMQVLWKINHGFLKDILEHIEEPKQHSNTIATLLKILVDKKFAAMRCMEGIIFTGHWYPKRHTEKKPYSSW